MKKKLLFTAYSLGLGGIEKALINLLNKLDYDRYDVTLILEKKDGMFLDMVPPLVKVKEYKISDNKIVIPAINDFVEPIIASIPLQLIG